MSDRDRELILGYLLGALEDSETESLQARLQNDVGLRRQLAVLRRQLDRLEAAADDATPPPGLARRACDFVFAQARQPARGGGHDGMSPEAASPSGAVRLSWLDIAVAAAVLFLAGMVVAPAIHGSRFQARLRLCQDNMRQLGFALADYSQRNDGCFPRVSARGRLADAGVYAPTLVSASLLPETHLVLCPDSPLAAERVVIPSLEELETASAQEAERLRQRMGGSYGFCIGHMQNGVFVPTRNLGREQFAILSDAPSDSLPHHLSLNHGGRGQNVLFEDGHVMFLTCTQPCDSADDIFSNDHHLVAPGLHANDSVIVPSGRAPLTSTSDR